MKQVFFNPQDVYTKANLLINTYRLSMVSRKGVGNLNVNNLHTALGRQYKETPKRSRS